MYSNISKLNSGESTIRLVMKNRDKKLLHFTAMNTMGTSYEYSVTQVIDANINYLPLDFSRKNIDLTDDLEGWIFNRPISTNREHIMAVLKSLGVEGLDKLKMLIVNRACSVNDCFWIDYEESDLTFKDVNLYNNKFSEALGYVTFFGGTKSLGGRLVSPEITTQGVLGKKWVQEDDKLMLYKKGTSGGVNQGREPVTEYIAYLIANILCLDSIPYELKKYEGVLCTTCESFTNYSTGLLPMESYLKYKTSNVPERISLTKVLGIVKKDNVEHFNQLVDMYVFDYIIENRDRHLNNYGFLIDNDTNTIKSFAPVFDNGLSLHYSSMDGDKGLENPQHYTEMNAHGEFNVTVARALYVKSRHQKWGFKIKEQLDKGGLKNDILEALTMYYGEIDQNHFHYRAIIKLLYNRAEMLLRGMKPIEKTSNFTK